jgi:hypothetical protein
MSLVNHKTLENILQARYDFETCDEPLKSESKARYERLLDEVLMGKMYSRMQLAEALAPRYREYCRIQRTQERRRQL